jgi:hypothetical protein
MAQCEKCGNDGGRPYPLLYSAREDIAVKTAGVFTFTLTGVQDVLICDDCATATFRGRQRALRRSVVGVLGVCALVFIGIGWLGGDVWGWIVAAAALVVLVATDLGMRRELRTDAERLRAGGEAAASEVSRKVLPSGAVGRSPEEWALELKQTTGRKDYDRVLGEVRALVRTLPHRTSVGGPPG